MSLTLQCVSDSSKKPVSKKFPGSLAVSKLKLICSKLFGIAIGSLALSVQYPDCDYVLKLENDNDNLQYMGIPTGSTVLVDEL